MMDFFDDALDSMADKKNKSGGDGKAQHEASVRYKQWFGVLKPALDQVRKRSSSAPEGVDVSAILAKELGLKFSGEITFTLRNGEKKEFEIVQIEGKENILSRTSVPSINGRLQDELSAESMSDIYPSIESNGQTFPAIGWVSDPESGIIDVLDGSRRRMCCYLSDRPFTIYVAKGPLTYSQSKYIASVSRMTKSLSYREEGISLIDVMERNNIKDVKTLAASLDEPVTTVQHKVNAGRLSDELLSVFPNYNSMPGEMFKSLHSFAIKVEKSEFDYLEIIAEARGRIDEIQSDDTLNFSDSNRKILKALTDSLRKLTKNGETEIVKPVPIRQFKDKNRKATILTTKTKTDIVLKRIPREKVRLIEEFLKDVLADIE